MTGPWKSSVRLLGAWLGAGWLLAGGAPQSAAQLPAAFDLRNIDGTNACTPVKNQRGGTCWTHAVMAALEGNLLRSGAWQALGHTNRPNLAEYHLDWWSGFNQHHNGDAVPPTGNGLTVHQGGDYRVAAAYLARGEGAVSCAEANDGTEYDDNWYDAAPARASNTYEILYARDIEWLTMGDHLERIAEIKSNLVANGVMGTCMYYGGGFYSGGTHYQPPSDTHDPNHAIALIGWDDAKVVATAPSNGAWLCKNSWGSGWNGDGHFWISYYDKHAGRHPQMGAVAFRNVGALPYQHVYGHDEHGWRDQMAASRGFNVFTTATGEVLAAVSFYTTTDQVDYAVNIYSGFTAGILHGWLAAATGRAARAGFHTVDLDAGKPLAQGQAFYVCLEVSAGGQAIDRTSSVDVLLTDPRSNGPEDPALREIPADMGKGNRRLLGTEVVSAAAGGESFYESGGAWVDVTNYNPTANLCIKGLTLRDTDGDGLADVSDPDDDNDGAGDAEEAVAGTAPDEPSSCFRVASAVVGHEAQEWVLSWSSASNRVYTIHYATNLLTPDWMAVPTNLWSTPPVNTWTVAPPVETHSLYYRLQVQD